MSIADAPGVLTDRLGDGERLTWWGRPKQGLMLRKGDWFQISCALCWLSILIGAQRAGLGLPNGFAVLLILGALWFGGGRYLHDARRRSRTVYGLTSDKAVIATPSSCRMIDIGALGDIQVEEQGNGRGSIVFGPAPSAWNLLLWSTTPLVPSFEGIENVRRIFSMIRTAQKSAGA